MPCSAVAIVVNIGNNNPIIAPIPEVVSLGIYFVIKLGFCIFYLFLIDYMNLDII